MSDAMLSTGEAGMGVIPGHSSSGSWDVPGSYKDGTCPFTTAPRDGTQGQGPCLILPATPEPPKGRPRALSQQMASLHRKSAGTQPGLPFLAAQDPGAALSFTLLQGGREERVVASSGLRLTSGGMTLRGLGPAARSLGSAPSPSS